MYNIRMKKILPILLIAVTFVSCNKPSGELVGIGNKGTFREANPFGMIFVKRGSFMMGANDQSALGGLSDLSKNVTVDAFWMDETEVTNDLRIPERERPGFRNPWRRPCQSHSSAVQ